MSFTQASSMALCMSMLVSQSDFVDPNFPFTNTNSYDGLCADI